MEIAQEAPQVLMMDSNIHDHDHGYVNVVVKKRKRTKRQRALSSPNLVAGITTATTTTTTTSTSSSTGGTGAGLNVTSSSSDHHQFSESSSEEEDMANCLILLAQGHNNSNNIGSKRPIEEIIAGTAIEKCQILTEVAAAAPITTFTSTICKQLATTGFDAYECKTCNRCFPSFQALGGHRASHKRPIKALGLIQDQEQKKMTISTSTTSGFLMMEQEETQFINENTIIHPSLTLQMGSNKNNNINSNRILSSSTSTSTSNHHHHHQSNNNKSRIHECSICGSEFSSGQALGGHMRRHRSSTITTTSSTAIMSSSQLETASTNKKSRNNGLSLDLNLPAPEEDHMNKFIFASKQQQPALVVFSAASLVDCHY